MNVMKNKSAKENYVQRDVPVHVCVPVCLCVCVCDRGSQGAVITCKEVCK